MKNPAPAFALIASLLLFSSCVSYTPNGPSLLYGYYLIQGTSMSPTIDEPSVVLVKPLPYNTIRAGDIIVFYYRDNLIVHRAIRRVGGAWLTQGDGLRSPDSIRVTAINYRGMVYRDSSLGGDLQGILHATSTPGRR